MKWCSTGNTYSLFDSGIDIADKLPVGVYQLKYDERRKLFELSKMSDKFDFNYKIYGIERDFINRVLKTYDCTTGNLGILLYGIKGTGKTVTAKIIANCLNNPCIIVNQYYSGISEFLSSIDDDCTIFFDEFEKGFCKDCEENGIADLLSLMDGVYTSGGRKTYLLTCNEPHIDDSFLGRPSRIRYSKEFGNLSLEIVKEYLDDNLVNKEFVNDVITMLNRLSIVSMDTIKCLVDEVNIHGYTDEMLDDFNVEKQKFVYKTEYSDDNYVWTLESFREYLDSVSGKPYNERFEKIRENNITLDKPVNELVFNDCFFVRYTELMVIRPITEDHILTCKDHDNVIVYLHIVEGGKLMPFFQNAF